MVKNKALPDSARLCTPCLVTLSLSLPFSLSPSQTWPYQGWSHMPSLSLTDAVHPEGTPLDPVEAGPWQGSNVRWLAGKAAQRPESSRLGWLGKTTL